MTPDRDGFTRATRPYPFDQPLLVTCWNPACTCGHAERAHDYVGDAFDPAYGACETPGCDCRRFDNAENPKD